MNKTAKDILYNLAITVAAVSASYFITFLAVLL